MRVVALRGGVGPERDGDAELFHRLAAVEPRGLGLDYHSTGQAGVHVLLSAFHSQRGGAVLVDGQVIFGSPSPPTFVDVMSTARQERVSKVLTGWCMTLSRDAATVLIYSTVSL